MEVLDQIRQDQLIANSQLLTAGKEYRENNRKPFWMTEGDALEIRVTVLQSAQGNKQLAISDGDAKGKKLALSSNFDILQMSEEIEVGDVIIVQAINRRPILTRSKADVEEMEKALPGSMQNYLQARKHYEEKGKHLYECLLYSLMLDD